MKPSVLLAFPHCWALAQSLRAGLQAESAQLDWRYFPDGESLVALRGDFADRNVVIVATLRDPDRLALPLLFAARTARDLGARSVGLVAPYLAYMRQDARFHSGESVASVLFAEFVSSAFDWLVAVDPHQHRNQDVSELFRIPVELVSSMMPVAEWIRGCIAKPCIVGPDGESRQWVEPLAAELGAAFATLAKQRRDDRSVQVAAPRDFELDGATPVLFDDIISTGRTMIQAVARLREAGARSVVCVGIHAVFAENAELWLRAAGADAIATTNTIEHPTNAIDVASPLIEAVARRLHD